MLARVVCHHSWMSIDALLFTAFRTLISLALSLTCFSHLGCHGTSNRHVSLGSSWLWQLLRLISLLITLKVLESAGQVFFQMFLSWNLSGVFSCLNCTDGLLEERSQRSSFLTTSCQGHHSLMTGHYWYHGPRTEVVLGGSALSQICSRMLWWWVLFLEITSIAFIHFSKRPGRQ